MKGLFTIATAAFFALTSFVGASPIAASNSLDITKRDVELVDVDIIVTDLFNEVVVINKNYNATCADSCSTTIVKSWCKEIADKCYAAIERCKKLPSGHKFPGLVTIIVDIVVKLLLEINFTLKFLLAKCGFGLLQLVGAVLVLVLGVVAELITALNALLVCLAIYVPGLLALVAALLSTILGAVGCLLCTLGLVLV